MPPSHISIYCIELLIVDLIGRKLRRDEEGDEASTENKIDAEDANQPGFLPNRSYRRGRSRLHSVSGKS